MKKAGLGLLIGVVLMVAALNGFGQRSDVFAQRPQSAPAPAGSGDLTVVPIPSGDKGQGQLLAVIEPRQQVMSVYRIDVNTGKIALRSVRNLRWDLQMTNYNNEAPLPQEIQSLLEQR
jgi:hypothetical protein